MLNFVHGGLGKNGGQTARQRFFEYHRVIDMFLCGWFSSGRGQGSIDLLKTAHQKMLSGFIPGRIAYVFCDRAPNETPAATRFAEVVESLNLPLVIHSSRELREKIRLHDPEVEEARLAFDHRIIELLSGYEVRVVVLAGYMLVLSPFLCQRLLCLNLHPAMPGGPTGTWRQVMWRLIETEASEAGAMMHLVSPELDKGPPVTYFHFSLRGPHFDPLWESYRNKRRRASFSDIRSREGVQEPLFARLRAEELRREFPLIFLTLQNLATGRLVLTPMGVKTGDRLVPGGFDITDQIEAYLTPRG
ncbi:formyltransferase family protein [Desulfobacca acetoxidans]|nr:formyl transferase [Desulfobacterales bacterium]